MRRSDRIRSAAFALAVCAAARGAAADTSPQRYVAPIAIAHAAPFVQLSLPPSAYAHSLQADLRDLRIVDARGERVAFALLAQAGFRRCASSRSRTESGFDPGSLPGSAGTIGGGAGGGVPRMFCSSHFPRSTGDVRLG